MMDWILDSSQRMAACQRGLVALGLACIASTASPSRKVRIRSSEAGSLASFAFRQLILDAPELLQRSLQALHDLPRQHRRIGQIVGVFQAFALSQEIPSWALSRFISSS